VDLLVNNGVECLIYLTRNLSEIPCPALTRLGTGRLTGEGLLGPAPLLPSELVLTLVGHEVSEQKCCQGILDDVEGENLYHNFVEVVIVPEFRNENADFLSEQDDRDHYVPRKYYVH
jgi:hypothetical protein